MIEGREMLELILRRQSDRKYSDKSIEKEKLERIIEAGRMAPFRLQCPAMEVYCGHGSGADREAGRSCIIKTD
jgi:nitroreductase